MITLMVLPTLQAAESTEQVAGPAMPGAYSSDTAGYGLSQQLGLDELGLELSVWGWAQYAQGTEYYRHSWWGELELDVTKTFGSRVSVAADIEFRDWDDIQRGDFEQLFTSVLLSPETGTILTIGKFNLPFGVEPHDFWDRYTGTPSLLFAAKPQNMRGVMLTAPIADSGFTLRPFVITGYNDQDAFRGHPTAGLMVEFHRDDKFRVAVTNLIGPGLANRHGEEEEEEDEDPLEYNFPVFAWTNPWWSADFKSARAGMLYVLDAQVSWKPRRDLTLQAEFLLGDSRAQGTHLFWDGVLVLANFDFDDQWRAFTQWSFINDPRGEVTGAGQQRQEVSLGAAYRLNKHFEFRAEYRHDFSTLSEDVDSGSVSISFGY